MGRRNRRTFQPKFFLFLILIAGVMLGIVYLSHAVKDYIAGCNSSQMLEVDVSGLTEADQQEVEEQEEELSGDTSTVAPVAVAKESTVRKLNKDAVYSVTGSNLNGFSYDIRLNNEEKLYSASPKNLNLYLADSESYSSVEGLLTFAGNNYRNSFSAGTVGVTMENIKSGWSKPVGTLLSQSGTGWTGQPLLVKWPDEVLSTLGVNENCKTMDDFIEVIYPAADGVIYFYDLYSGLASRDPINVGASILGTAALDPLGRPMLYVGQGVMTKNNKNKDVSFVYAVDLIKNEVVYEFGGRDYFARRESWNAFDSSPLIINDTLICPSESGIIYFFPLNTKYDSSAGTISIKPSERLKYRYSGPGYSASNANGKPWYGYESSAAVFRNYLYITDNGGYLQCIDLNTLQLQYTVNVGGDADATVVLEEDGNAETVYLYAASQTDKAVSSLPEGWGFCSVKKIDALTGRIVWEDTSSRVSYVGDGSFKSGVRATPHVGTGSISDIVIYAFSGAGIIKENGEDYSYGGRVCAYNKTSGEIVWAVETPGYADYQSSPCVVYTEWGAAYMILCDRSGTVSLYKITSESCTKCKELELGARIESTPAAYGNYFVVGTSGKKADGSDAAAKIWCIVLE